MIKQIVSKDNLGSYLDIGGIEAGKINPSLPVNNVTPVSYVPTATNNPVNRNEFVVDINGDTWFIDYAGDALKMSSASSGGVSVTDNANGTVTVNGGAGQTQDAIRPINELSALSSIHIADKFALYSGVDHKSVLAEKVLPAINSVQLSYTPSLSGNPTTERNQFVKGLDGKTYFIDVAGKSVLIDSTIAVKATLTPVKDFTTTSNLSTLALTANDGDSWIVSDGTNKSDIATWDAVNVQWLYYSPSNNEYTSITTGLNAGTSWFYQAATDTWIQDSSAGPVLPPPVQPVAGNIALPSSNYGNARRGPVIIQNNELTAWGGDDDGSVHAGDDVATRFPHRVAWNWNALNTPPTRSANYVPKFVDFAGTTYTSFAVDHKGKLWGYANNQSYIGTSMAQNPILGLSPIPFFQTLNEKIVGISTGNWGDRGVSVWTEYGNVYSTGQNSFGEYGNGTTVQNTTSWSKMNLPVGKFAKSVKRINNMSSGVTLVHCTDNSLYGCGRNQYSMFATGTANQLTPVLISTNVLDYATDGESIILAKTDNTLWVRGLNANGQLGTGNTTNVTAALTQVSGINDAIKVWMQADWYNGNMSAYLSSNGIVKFAGYNNDGAFGMTAQNTNKTVFTAPSFAAQGTITDVLLGRNTSTVLTSSGDIWNAGLLSYRGQGKNSSAAAENEKFMQVSLPASAVGIRYGGYYDGAGNDPEYFVALLSNGTVFTYSSNYGNSYNNNYIYSPQQIPLLVLDNGAPVVGYSVNLMTQVATLQSVSSGTFTQIYDGATTTATFTIPYTSNQPGYLSVIPVITGTWGGSAISVSNIQQTITAPANTGNLVFTADITLADSASLTPPNTSSLSLNVSFGALSATASGNVIADAIALALTTNRSVYTNAANGSSILITASEYTALQSAISGNFIAGNKDAPALYTINNDWGNNAIGFTPRFTGTNGAVTAQVPANNWVYAFAFKTGTAQTGRQYRFQLMTANATTGAYTVGDIQNISNTVGEIKYVVIKGGSQVSVNSDIAVFGGSFSYASIVAHLTFYGTTIGTYNTSWTTNAIYIQALTTPTKQW